MFYQISTVFILLLLINKVKNKIDCMNLDISIVREMLLHLNLNANSTEIKIFLRELYYKLIMYNNVNHRNLYC